MTVANEGLSPSAASERLRALMWALEDGDFAAAERLLARTIRTDTAGQAEVLLAFDRHCADPSEPSWKMMTRVATSASKAGFCGLAERALERLSTWPVGLPKVYADAVQLSLACARLDLAAIFSGKLKRDFAAHKVTAGAVELFEESRRQFERIAALGDEPDDHETESLPDPRADLARALLDAGRPAEALEASLELVAEDCADLSVWTLIGEAYQRMGQIEMAARAYRHAISPDPTVAPSAWVERLGDVHLADGNPHMAIRCFGLCSYRNTHDIVVRRKLAQATGRVWKDRLKTAPWHRRDGVPRYFDCFMFNGEFDLARMRFTELWDHVDKFVVVEAAKTFTGNDKPLFFEENMDLFAEFREKIIHVTVKDFPDYCEYPWSKDFYQRDAVAQGLDGVAAEEDFVVIADADELWRWDVVSRFDGDVATMRMRMAKNFLNYQPLGTGRANRDTAAIARYRIVRENGASAVRFNLGRIQRKQSGFWLDDAGWHFHAIGDERFIQYKFSSYAHREHHNKPDLVQLERVRDRLNRLRAGEYEPDWTAVPLGCHMPACVQRDPASYEHILLPTDAGVLSDWIRRLSVDEQGTR